MSYLFTYFAFLLVDSLYLCQFITCLFLNKVWGDLIVFHNLLRTSFHPEHCGAKNPGLIMAYIAATLNPEILKNFPGPVRVGKKKVRVGLGSGYPSGPGHPTSAHATSPSGSHCSCIAHVLTFPWVGFVSYIFTAQRLGLAVTVRSLLLCRWLWLLSNLGRNRLVDRQTVVHWCIM